MPIELRNFYYDKLVKTKKKEKEEIDKSKKRVRSNSPVSRFKR
tara:strand:- start:61 stop:189 length:129 start_codon:yes stop_codon:yes gene_type:complete